MGNLSDQYGRRSVLLFSLLGFGIDYLILAFAPSYSWLLIGRIIAGITGASFTTASAYIADISTPENRSKNFGMIERLLTGLYHWSFVGWIVGTIKSEGSLFMQPLLLSFESILWLFCSARIFV